MIKTDQKIQQFQGAHCFTIHEVAQGPEIPFGLCWYCTCEYIGEECTSTVWTVVGKFLSHSMRP